MTEIVVAAFVFLGTVAGLVKVYMSHNFKLKMKLIDAEEAKNRRGIAKLNEVVDYMRVQLREHQSKMDVLMGQLRINKEMLDRNQIAQTAFISETQKRIKTLEEQVEKIGKVIIKP